MENPFISVIITAYNRKEFILEALQSAVNQTLKRDKYEIICIKNFKDAKIDRYIKDNGIINNELHIIVNSNYYLIKFMFNNNSTSRLYQYLD